LVTGLNAPIYKTATSKSNPNVLNLSLAIEIN